MRSLPPVACGAPPVNKRSLIDIVCEQQSTDRHINALNLKCGAQRCHRQQSDRSPNSVFHVLGAGKLQADAAAAEGVDVFIFSTLEDVEARTQARTVATYSARLLSSEHRS